MKIIGRYHFFGNFGIDEFVHVFYGIDDEEDDDKTEE